MVAKNANKLVEKIEESQDSSIISTEVGRLFREERERRGLTIKSISEELHIRQLYLTCIEEGRLCELPGYVYIVGFIKSYCNFLDLNAEEILHQLNLTSQPQVVYSNVLHSIPTDEQQLPTKKVLFASLTVLFVSGLLTYVYNNKSDSDTLVDDPFALSDKGEGEFNPLLLSADPQGGVVQSGNPQKSASKETVAPPSAQLDDTVTQNSQIGFKKNESAQSETTDTPISVLKADSPTSTATPTSAIVTSEITVIAVKDSWVQIMNSKGSSVYVRLMHAGEKYTLPASAPKNPDNPSSTDSYVMNTGNGGGIKISVDGQETKTLGESGKIMRGVVLTPENLKTYMPAE